VQRILNRDKSQETGLTTDKLQLQHECQVTVDSMQQVRHARRRVPQTWFAAVASRTCC